MTQCERIARLDNVHFWFLVELTYLLGYQFVRSFIQSLAYLLTHSLVISVNVVLESLSQLLCFSKTGALNRYSVWKCRAQHFPLVRTTSTTCSSVMLYILVVGGVVCFLNRFIRRRIILISLSRKDSINGSS